MQPIILQVLKLQLFPIFRLVQFPTTHHLVILCLWRNKSTEIRSTSYETHTLYISSHLKLSSYIQSSLLRNFQCFMPSEMANTRFSVSFYYFEVTESVHLVKNVLDILHSPKFDHEHISNDIESSKFRAEFSDAAVHKVL